jgi:hypothetical protein
MNVTRHSRPPFSLQVWSCPDTLSITGTVWNRADRPAWADIRTFTCRSASSLHRPPLAIVVLVLRVVLADDNFLVREGVAALLTEAPEITVVASVGDVDELLEAVARLRPDAVLTDICAPAMPKADASSSSGTWGTRSPRPHNPVWAAPERAALPAPPPHALTIPGERCAVGGSSLRAFSVA